MPKKNSKPYKNAVKTGGHKELSKDNDRKITGSLHVTGEIETQFSPDFITKQDSKRREDDAREKKKFRVEVLTLIGVAAYTVISLLQWWAVSDQAESARKSNELLVQQLLPYIVMKQIDFRQPIVARVPTPLMADFVNEGGSAAFEVRPRMNIDRRSNGDKPDYIFHDITGSTGTIAAKSPFDAPGEMRAISQEEINGINAGTIVIYVSGEISYSDFTRKRHHAYFCVQYEPRSAKMVGCKEQKQSD